MNDFLQLVQVHSFPLVQHIEHLAHFKGTKLLLAHVVLEYVSLRCGISLRLGLVVRNEMLDLVDHAVAREDPLLEVCHYSEHPLLVVQNAVVTHLFEVLSYAVLKRLL